MKNANLVIMSVTPSLRLKVSIVADGLKPFEVQLDRRAAQQLAVVLSEYAGAPSDLLRRGIGRNVDYIARCISGEFIEEYKPKSTGVRIGRPPARIL